MQLCGENRVRSTGEFLDPGVRQEWWRGAGLEVGIGGEHMYTGLGYHLEAGGASGRAVRQECGCMNLPNPISVSNTVLSEGIRKLLSDLPATLPDIPALKCPSFGLRRAPF